MCVCSCVLNKQHIRQTCAESIKANTPLVGGGGGAQKEEEAALGSDFKNSKQCLSGILKRCGAKGQTA